MEFQQKKYRLTANLADKSRPGLGRSKTWLDDLKRRQTLSCHPNGQDLSKKKGQSKQTLQTLRNYCSSRKKILLEMSKRHDPQSMTEEEKELLFIQGIAQLEGLRPYSEDYEDLLWVTKTLRNHSNSPRRLVTREYSNLVFPMSPLQPLPKRSPVATNEAQKDQQSKQTPCVSKSQRERNKPKKAECSRQAIQRLPRSKSELVLFSPEFPHSQSCEEETRTISVTPKKDQTSNKPSTPRLQKCWSDLTISSPQTTTRSRTIGTMTSNELPANTTLVSMTSDGGKENSCNVEKTTGDMVPASPGKGSLQPKMHTFNAAMKKAAMEQAAEATNQTLTKEQNKTIEKAFKAIDVNRKGRLSAKNVKLACTKLGIILTNQELQDMMDEADKDKNGYIDFEEFRTLIGHQLVIANYKHEKMKEAFRQFDIDGDGVITADEIKAVFASTGVDMDDNEVAALVREADTNGDGVISYDEFVHAVCDKDW